MEAFGGCNQVIVSILMDFQTLLSAVQIKQCKDFQFGNQFRGNVIRTPDYAGRDDNGSKVSLLRRSVQWQFSPWWTCGALRA